MDTEKYCDVLVSGSTGFYFGHWNLSRGVREREEQRRKQNPNGDDRKSRDAKRVRICYNDEAESGSAE